MTNQSRNSPGPEMSRFWIGAIVIGIALKIGLLITSQSMPDGDEAVEGLMAMHILAKGVHPVYPYGINYGAGAGWEAHLAALLFAIFGPSEVVLKCVGLFHYLVTMGLVAALARFWRGPNAGLLAAGLFATAPQTAQWALKCAGGHQVAVILALAAWLCVLRGQIALAVVLLPLAAFAHPIVLPFVAAITVCLLIFCNSWRDRGLRFVGVVVAAVIELVLLRPPSQSVWNPMSTSIDLPKRLIAFPRLVVGMFNPNLNSPTWPSGWEAIVAILWLVAVALAFWQRQQPSWNRLVLVASAGVVAMVASSELVSRHLLIASPVAVVVLACGLTPGRLWLRGLALLLAVSGCAVQVCEAFDPCIHGPGIQSPGIDRANFAAVIDELKANEIQFVYCIDPMLQWNIVFASRERILARWVTPTDRVPEYVQAVDQGRQRGKRIAVVAPKDSSRPIRFKVIPDPPDKLIDTYFKPSAALVQPNSSQR